MSVSGHRGHAAEHGRPGDAELMPQENTSRRRGEARGGRKAQAK
jgi:hypothetical protein